MSDYTALQVLLGLLFLGLVLMGVVTLLENDKESVKGWFGRVVERMTDGGRGVWETIGRAFVRGKLIYEAIMHTPGTGTGSGRGSAETSQRTKRVAVRSLYPAHMPTWMSPGHVTDTDILGQAAPEQPGSGFGALQEHLRFLAERSGEDSYRVPVGWFVRQHGGIDLACATFTPGRLDSVVNILVSGQVGSGKDAWVRTLLLSLMTTNEPTALQVGIADGKGLDYMRYRDLAHVPMVADLETMKDFIAWVDAERARRKEVLLAHGAKSWDRLPVGSLPLLVVYVSELTLLERHIGGFWDWLNDHLTLDRAYGMSFVVGTQTAANTPTRWRRQIQLFVAGSQSSTDDNRPNTSWETIAWTDRGLPPPSALHERGTYAVVRGNKGYHVRGHFVPDGGQRSPDEEALILARLPVQRKARPEPVVADGEGYPTDAAIRAWAEGRRHRGEQVSQNAACFEFFGGKNPERMAFVRQAFVRLGYREE